jgi:Uma2 family endonuclease
MPIPEGTKVEVVGGNIFMSPQRQTHWEIIFNILEQLRPKYPIKRLASDVRIDFPGHLNGFACDVAALADRSVKDDKGRWRYQDVEFIAEVTSKDTAANDYGPKMTAYAAAGVRVYLIADPYEGRCHLYTQPKDGEYLSELSIAFGADVDMTNAAARVRRAVRVVVTVCWSPVLWGRGKRKRIDIEVSRSAPSEGKH